MLLFTLISSPLQFLYFIIAILFSLTIHEFAHAFVADRLGDDTPRRMGRLSINPIAHLDLWGTVFLLLAGFGWGKPVVVNSRNFPNPRLDNLTVSLAGPMSNLLLATIFGLIYRFAPLPHILQSLFIIVVFYNLVFMIFNLIPIPPLDGSKILGLFISEEAYNNLQQYGMLILFGLIIFSSAIPVIPYILNHVVGYFFTLITGQPVVL
jgi:Zn-dependent protease